MRLKNFLLAVSDIERSKEFYIKYFGMFVMKDHGENVIMSDGHIIEVAERKVQI